MTKFLLKYADGDEPFMVMEAVSRYSTPTSIEKGPGKAKALSGGVGYAERLAKSSLKASVMGIASRMGRDVIVEAEGEEPSVEDMLKEARGEKVQEAEAPVEKEIDLMADGEIAKTDDDQQIVFGWAYVTHDHEGNVNVDKSGDFVDLVEEIEKSAYDYVLRSRKGDSEHSNVQSGRLVESIVFTPEKIEKMGIPAGVVPNGWWLGFKVDDDQTWQRVKNGELRSFSIHGRGTRSKVG